MHSVALIVLALQVVSPAQTQTSQRPQAPPRDAPARQTGAAVLRGRVVAADTKRPLRRARVTVAAAELAEPRTISTDGGGKWKPGPTT
jgi:hypothetical protein